MVKLKRSWKEAFQCAWRGISYCLQQERNMKIHFAAAIFILLCAVFNHFDALRFVILLLVIALVISLEIVNTAIERTVDLLSPAYHPLAGRIKDIAAGAVLAACIAAGVIGYLLFFGYE